MLKYIHDKEGVISWLLSQIGLLIATGILLASIASLTFYSDWQKEAEIKAIASNFATAIETADLQEFPKKSSYHFPKTDYYYEVTISTDYITVKRNDGMVSKKIVAREALLIHPWISPPMINTRGAEGFYDYLESRCEQGQDGSSPSSRIPRNIVENAFNESRKELIEYPLNIDINEPVFIEKVFVYYTEGGRGSYVLVYQ